MTLVPYRLNGCGVTPAGIAHQARGCANPLQPPRPLSIFGNRVAVHPSVVPP